MNDLEYLQQISAGVPQPAQSTNFFDKRTKLMLIVFGGILLLAIILMIAFSSSANNQPTETSELTRLYHYSTSVEKTIDTYLKSLKSSSLRSTTSSLFTIVSEVKTTTNSTLAAREVELKDTSLPAQDADVVAKSDQALNSAQLNGILDRKFASEMYYHIEYLLILEKSVAQKTADATLLNFLSSSSESLSRLSVTFNSFSESK